MLLNSLTSGLLSTALVVGMALGAPAPGGNSRPGSGKGKIGQGTCDQFHGPRSPGSCHTASNRGCWKDGFSITTDYEAAVPSTGFTKTYTLTLTEKTGFAPDGHDKAIAMLVNDQYPAPLIEADWGDMIEITVINNLLYNGTSIHWHGIRQLNNAINDGVNGITECAIPPGHRKTYRFLAEQYGTSWYHSHFSTQYANGVVGPIVIHGPASLPYDIDLGPLMITDWYYGAADAITAYVQDPKGSNGRPPISDNILFNGMNVSPTNGSGKYASFTLEKGKRHRLRLINPSVENSFTVSLVDHDMTVIETDFVPVNSYTTSSLFIGIGQRYDVTIDASQAVDNYWFNVTMNGPVCGDTSAKYPAAIFHYKGASEDSLPTKTGSVPVDHMCQDSVDFVPVVSRTGQISGSFHPDSSSEITVQLAGNATNVFWNLAGHPMNVDWSHPTLQYVKDNQVDQLPVNENVFSVGKGDEWSVWLIQDDFGIPHPMHLHGHDFLVLGRSPAVENPLALPAPRTFDEAKDMGSLQLHNPTRRDTTMLPGNGWLIVAFRTDNPGAWLFHCHISWHVSQGLSVQYLERESEIASKMDLNALNENCANWRAYKPPYPKIDSGLKERFIGARGRKTNW